MQIKLLSIGLVLLYFFAAQLEVEGELLKQSKQFAHY